MISIEQLRGTTLEGQLQLEERSINELLHAIAPRRQLTLQVSDNNRILVQVGSFHANATIARQVSLSPTPRLQLRLDSLLIATALRAIAPQPLVRVRGREVEIDLAAVPGIEDALGWLSHLTRLDIVTRSSTLRLHFLWAIEG